MKKKVLSIVIWVLLTAIITSCASTDDSIDTTWLTEGTTSEPVKSNQELVLEGALKLEKEGAWYGAYKSLDYLIEHGYYTEYAEKRDSLYLKSELVNNSYFAVGQLKSMLKDPDSLKIYDVTVTASQSQYDDSYIFEFEFEYGATNSFGAMVRDTEIITCSGRTAKEYDVGETLNVSFIRYNDLTDMTRDELSDQMGGDYLSLKYKYPLE